jgi:hypothetical protein
MSTRWNIHMVQTRKEIHRPGQEIAAGSKVLFGSFRGHRAETESTVAKLRQEVKNSPEQIEFNKSSISGEVRTSI